MAHQTLDVIVRIFLGIPVLILLAASIKFLKDHAKTIVSILDASLAVTLSIVLLYLLGSGLILCFP